MAFSSQLDSAEAFISGETIGNWFINALKDFAWWIVGGLQSLGESLGNRMKNWVSDLIGNVFHSLSSATTVFKGNANITITRLLNPGEEENGLPQSMKFLIGIMEAGPLPMESYYIRVELEKEMDHLKDWVSIM